MADKKIPELTDEDLIRGVYAYGKFDWKRPYANAAEQLMAMVREVVSATLNPSETEN